MPGTEKRLSCINVPEIGTRHLICAEEIVPQSDQSHTSAASTPRPRWSWIPLGRPGRSLSEIGFGRRKENAEKVEELSPLGCISPRQPEVEFVFGGCHLWVVRDHGYSGFGRS